MCSWHLHKLFYIPISFSRRTTFCFWTFIYLKNINSSSLIMYKGSNNSCIRQPSKSSNVKKALTLHVCFRKYKQCFDVSVTTHLVYAIADISIEGQNRFVLACWVLGTKVLWWMRLLELEPLNCFEDLYWIFNSIKYVVK